MIEGGKGGATTNKFGLAFEKRVDLRLVFQKLKGYEVKNNDLYFDNKLVGKFYKKYSLYSELLQERKINWENILSKRLLPDETLFVLQNNTLFVIEMKFQKVSGSVDEKLQTCDYKLKQYKRLFENSRISVRYIYVLNDWFMKEEYRDTLNYIKSVGCDYYFERLPLEVLGLPDPKK